jgi:hypothetical protein
LTGFKEEKGKTEKEQEDRPLAPIVAARAPSAQETPNTGPISTIE